MLADVITKTTSEQRKRLTLAGFVHVTGLTAWGPMNDKKSVIGEDQPGRWLGHYDANNGMGVIVTTGGEVWLATVTQKDSTVDSYTLRARLLDELCPNGRGAFVPCSNGEWIHSTDLIRRLSDPDCESTSR